MTVFWVESFDRVDHLPYQAEFSRWIARMTPQDLIAVREELDRRFDGSEIETAGWIPGSDWSGTVWSPIYHDAAQGNYDLAARIFGLLVFEAAMRHPEDWVTGRFEKDGVPIGSRTYFRPGNAAALRK